MACVNAATGTVCSFMETVMSSPSPNETDQLSKCAFKLKAITSLTGISLVSTLAGYLSLGEEGI